MAAVDARAHNLGLRDRTAAIEQALEEWVAEEWVADPAEMPPARGAIGDIPFRAPAVTR